MALVCFLFKHFILAKFKHSGELPPLVVGLISRWNFQFLAGVIIFGSVQFISKKNNQIEFFSFKKNRNGSNRPVSVRFGFLGKKPVQTSLARFWLGFLRVWLGFRFIKPKPNRTGRFFQNFNRFFFTVQFFRLLFSSFLGFLGFFYFFTYP